MPESGPLIDRFGREHTYLRVGVTDRCNYRCTYCMPLEGISWLPRERVLTFEEITRIVSVLANLGVRHVRLTGGEPLSRQGVEELVGQICVLPGIDEVAMTTNGHFFSQRGAALAKAGLKRVNFSIDTLSPHQFAQLTRGGDLSRVLRGVEAARENGLYPIKINVVIMKGVNDGQLERFVEYFAPQAQDVVLRFIEYMPFAGNNAHQLHYPAQAIRRRLARSYDLQPVARICGVGPARNWKIQENGLRIGFISPITEHFCHECNRLRLMADGHLRTCLSRDATPSLREILRAGVSDVELEVAIRQKVWQKVSGHEAHGDGFVAFEGVMTRAGG